MPSSKRPPISRCCGAPGSSTISGWRRCWRRSFRRRSRPSRNCWRIITRERAQRELDLQLALGLALIATKGQAAPEVGHVYTRARALCQQAPEAPQLFRVLWGLWHFHVVGAELQTVRQLSEELLTLAQHLHDPLYLLGAHWTLGGAGFCLGEFAPACAQWE